jgi:hypothetical protein
MQHSRAATVRTILGSSLANALWFSLFAAVCGSLVIATSMAGEPLQLFFLLSVAMVAAGAAFVPGLFVGTANALAAKHAPQVVFAPFAGGVISALWGAMLAENYYLSFTPLEFLTGDRISAFAVQGAVAALAFVVSKRWLRSPRAR